MDNGKREKAGKCSVGATRKVSPNWSQETMSCHSSINPPHCLGSGKCTSDDFASEQLQHAAGKGFLSSPSHHSLMAIILPPRPLDDTKRPLQGREPPL